MFRLHCKTIPGPRSATYVATELGRGNDNRLAENSHLYRDLSRNVNMAKSRHGRKWSQHESRKFRAKIMHNLNMNILVVLKVAQSCLESSGSGKVVNKNWSR